ncbi:GLEYA domain-containing protein, partial [Verticillium dahliae]
AELSTAKSAKLSSAKPSPTKPAELSTAKSTELSTAKLSSAKPSPTKPAELSTAKSAKLSTAKLSTAKSAKLSSAKSAKLSTAKLSSAKSAKLTPSSTQSSILPSSSAPAPTPDVTCNNSGLEYALYEHNFRNSDFPAYSSLNVGYFHTRQPLFTGITERIGIPPGTNPSTPFRIYDNAPSRLYQFTAVNHRAFLYAPVTGTYTVTVPVSDDITLVWLGDKAISTWTRANADLEQNYNTVTGPEDTVVFTIQLQAGTYTPFRLLWANAQGRLAFIAQVQAPDGRIIVDGDGSDSSYFVRFACDMSTPEYPPFGQDG